MPHVVEDKHYLVHVTDEYGAGAAEMARNERRQT